MTLQSIFNSLIEETEGHQQPFSVGHLNWREEIGMTDKEAERLIAIGAKNEAALIARGRAVARERASHFDEPGHFTREF